MEKYDSALVPITAEQKAAVRVVFEKARRMTKCTGMTWVVDHEIPLSLGGDHLASNLSVIPKVINARKSDSVSEILTEKDKHSIRCALRRALHENLGFAATTLVTKWISYLQPTPQRSRCSLQP